jgi:hypothetical protein
MFHSSYLQIHAPNDDRLFPGWLDNQVTEFETQEKEWAVDHILSHKGSRSDAVFEVKWKAGNVTWLPYDQVDHLGALQDYFNVLGVETVADLADGNFAPTVEHYHVFIGGMGMQKDYYKTPTRRRNHATNRLPSQTMSSANSNPTLPAPLLHSVGNGRFMLPDHYRPTITMILTLDQIRLYLQHDTDLHGGADPSSIPSPVGYDEFAIALNTNTGNGIQVAFINPEGVEGMRITGRPPALAELVGLEAARRTVTPAPRDPRETEGGTWLDPCRTELMGEALWDNLKWIKKQR